MCHRNQVEKGKDMDIIKKYKWDIFPLAILVIVVAIVTTQPSKKTKEVKNNLHCFSINKPETAKHFWKHVSNANLSNR